MSSNIIGAVASGVAAAASAAQNNNAATTGGAARPASEKDMFMTLLVAQLKHQDPLAPQDGTQFVTQLAQFNSLDQLIGIRSAIEGMVNRAGGGTEAGASKAAQG